jgi:hypothetical protein
MGQAVRAARGASGQITGVTKGGAEVTLLPWEQFLAWWTKAWQPGEHLYIAGQTGSGKTTTGIRLIEHRPYVVALDAKGMDSSLSASGWPRINTWLPRAVKEDIKDHRPVRIIVGGENNNDKQFEGLAALLRKSIKGIWAMGNWTLFADEGQILADTRYVGGGADIEKLLIAARDRHVSVVFSTQRPGVGLRAPTAIAAQQQATWLIVTRTRDTRVHIRLGELAGRPAKEMGQLIQHLPKFTWAVFGLDPYEPIRLVTPPPLPKFTAPKRSRLTTALWGYS